MNNEFEKRAFASKKFIAFLFMEIGLFLLMFSMILKGGYEHTIVFLVVIITAGFLGSFFIGGQALVDKYTRVALIAKGCQSNSGSPAVPDKELADSEGSSGTSSGNLEPEELDGHEDTPKDEEEDKR